MEEFLVLGLELERELRLSQQELVLKRTLLDEARQNLQSATAALQEVQGELIKKKTSEQELQAQLQVRNKATLKLEDENTQLRDAVAKLRVQVDSFSMDREGLLERCQKAEMELGRVTEEVRLLRTDMEGVVVFKERCLRVQNQTKETIDQVISKQAMLDKEQARLEKCRIDGLDFALEVTKQVTAQTEIIKQVNNEKLEMESRLVKLLALVEQLQAEKENLPLKEKHKEKESYIDEWKSYQHTMETRVAVLMEDNRQLAEELALVQVQTSVTNSCEHCKTKN